MQISDWVLIGSTIFLGATAFLVPYFIERWKYNFYSAKLNFKFFHISPYCHKTEMGRSTFRFPVYYFRFKVINNGKVQAEKCEAVLEKIYKEDIAGKFKKINGFSPVSLKWSGLGDEKYITIQPEREVFCDIGRIHHPDHEAESAFKDITEKEKNQNKFFFELPVRFFSQWDCLIHGRYEIEVAIYSKNAMRNSKKFKITWSGKWQDKESEMLDELVIS